MGISSGGVITGAQLALPAVLSFGSAFGLTVGAFVVTGLSPVCLPSLLSVDLVVRAIS